MPVHPTLAAILAEWKLTGWTVMFGRQPRPDDLVLPVAPGGKAEAGSMRLAHNSWLAMQTDLDGLRLRRRRVHDLRRTMISLARSGGARPDILKLCTHGSSKQMMDLYTSLPWETLCAEVAKLRVQRRSAANVVQLPVRTPADLGNGVGNDRENRSQPVGKIGVPNGI